MNSTAGNSAVSSAGSLMLLCPLCGRELDDASGKNKPGWNCKCGEFIPEALAMNPFEGCTSGLGCNCGREMRR